MSTTYITPDATSVAQLLEMMYGDDLAVKDAAAADFSGQYTATFLSDDDRLVALCTCDNAFVAYSGAALSMIPGDVANEMIADNDISEAVVANFYEVMNICSKLLMSETSAHLRLDKVLPPNEPADAVAALETATTVAPFEVEIPRYGKGSLSFVVS